MGGPGSGRKKGGITATKKGEGRVTTGFKNSRTWSKKVGKKTITYDYQGKVVKVKK
ncbi:MAG: hypothetical protein ABFD50_20635 [Smithella sp.]